MTFVQKLTRLIERNATTQADVEAALGLAQGRISKWIAGQGEPRLGQALQLARWFGVPMEWLADDTMDGLPPMGASGDILRTVVAITANLGAREALRRLLMSKEGDE